MLPLLPQAVTPALALIGSGPPDFPGIPANRTVAAGATAYLRLVAVGAFPLSYQWNCNGTNIPGATNTVLVLTNVQSGQAGNSYTLTATNMFGAATNGPIILGVEPFAFNTSPTSLSSDGQRTAIATGRCFCHQFSDHLCFPRPVKLAAHSDQPARQRFGAVPGFVGHQPAPAFLPGHRAVVVLVNLTDTGSQRFSSIRPAVARR